MLVLGATALGGCESRDVTAVKRAVAAQLRDPDGASFADVREGRRNWVCGTVNGRNAMGAYAGAQRFVGLGAGYVAIEPAPDSPSAALFEENWSACTGEPRRATDLAGAADGLDRASNASAPR